jgi:2-methylcitrate dehydratase PrpD
MAGFAGERLGRFVAASHWDDLPPAIRHEGKRSLLNFLGCALGVAHAPPIELALRVLWPLAGGEHVTVIGRSERLDMLGAAFINAVGGNLLDYDDTHLRTVIHPTAPVAPAALALTERHGLTGAAMLHAFILGAEVACRIGNAVSPGHYARGWHITATCGVFGAAAASAKLLGLDATRTWHALGIAASQSAGVVENLPSGAKNVGVGNAARNGIFAALLAEQGYTAAPAAIDGALGWAGATGDVFMVSEVTNDLGQRWEIGANTYKPYPCGIVMHAVIDACLTLRRQHELSTDQIDEVMISGDQLLLDRGDRAVANERDARVSIHHCAAVALLFGAAGLDAFSDSVVQAPDVVALRRRVKVSLDADSPRGAATAVVRTKDGRSLTSTILHARGSEQHPLTDADIEAKVRDLAGWSSFRNTIESIITSVWRLDSLPTIEPLVAALSGHP